MYKKILSICATVLLCLLTACASQPSRNSEHQSAPQDGWPRTITVPGSKGGPDTKLTISKQPKRIAALDYESAEVLAELGLAAQIALLPQANLNPALGTHISELDGKKTFPVAKELAAENVLAAEPDLVILSPRHGADNTIGKVLIQAGVPVLRLPQSWIDLEALASGIELIGKATGADAAAAQLSANLTQQITAAKNQNPSHKQVVVLSNQAGRPFVTAGKAYPLQLLKFAGAQDAGSKLGLPHSGPISAEQLVQLNPDGILLLDMNGSGDKMFKQLLNNPAVASLAAVQNQRLLKLPGYKAQAAGLLHTVKGLNEITEWVKTL